MRAMLIDDEKLALMHLERLLLADGRIEPVLLCTSAREGIDRLAQSGAEVVFLDIGMPEMNGLEAAEHIQQAYPGIAIVFVTAYSDYAVEAFDLQAIDYLLKPIGAPRLRKAVDRLVPYADSEQGGAKRGAAPGAVAEGASGAPAANNRPELGPDIRTFRRLELADPRSGEVRSVKWRTAKVQELLAYLLHQGEQWVRRDELIDLLWPEISADKAATHLHTSVYQLRKIMKEWTPQMKLEYRQESYRLLRGGAETDAERFASGAAALPDAAPDRELRMERLLSLWRGGYLEHHDYEWAKPRAAELKRLRFQLTLALAERERASGGYDEAIRRLSALQEEEPFAEDVCRQLMLTYETSGDKRRARECYQLLRRRLDEELGVEPESRTEQLYERLRS